MDRQQLDAVAAAAEKDGETRVALRNAHFRAALIFGDEPVLLEAKDGKVKFQTSKDAASKADFEVKAPASAWAEYCAGPTKSAISLFAMGIQGHLSKTGQLKSEFVFGGDERKLWANFHALSNILEHFRQGRA